MSCLHSTASKIPLPNAPFWRLRSKAVSETQFWYRVVMIGDMRQHLIAVPFKPFVIVMSSGQRYGIPSRDHAGIDPQGRRAVIWFDDAGSVTISGLHIVAIEEGAVTNGSGT